MNNMKHPHPSSFPQAGEGTAQKNTRAIAAKLLTACLNDGVSFNEQWDALSASNKVNANDHSFIQLLCYGVLREKRRLEDILSKLMNKALEKKHADIHWLLCIGLYQLLYLDTPERAVVHSTVQASYTLKKYWASKLINGVLRQFLREKSTYEAQAITHFNHRDWLLKLFKKEYPEHWQSICENNLIPAPMTLRVNQKQLMREDYVKKLSMPHQLTTHSTVGIRLEKACRVYELPDFKTGAVSVQDEAAQLAAMLLDPQMGDHVLDACSAPGGKLCHLLEQCDDIHVVAVDKSAIRLGRIQDNLQRLQLNKDKVELYPHDAAEPSTWWQGTLFDRILLDAPCSATGVIRRHPDILWLRQEQDIENLAQTQLHLLQQLWNVLKPNGILLYATCSVLSLENDKIINAFLQQTSNAKVMPIDAMWGQKTMHGRQILPGQEGMDGFFYAVLKKEG